MAPPIDISLQHVYGHTLSGQRSHRTSATAISRKQHKIFALTTRGLEDISARELAEQPEIAIREVAYRRIAASCAGSLAPLLGLRSVDDVFLEVARWTGIGRPRSTLERLCMLSARLDLRSAFQECAALRPVGAPPTFSVTASFVGKRNYSIAEIKTLVAKAITRRHGWRYTEDDRAADLNVRLFLEHETAIVGVRLAKAALHERDYRRVHLPGALKPPVAAALALLAQIEPGTTVLDPCCGSGTILVEAARLGATVSGGDSDPRAVAAARSNAQTAGIMASIAQWDARALPLASGSVERVLTNLPWGRQVRVDEGLASLYKRIFAEAQRVLAPGGRMVVLTNAPEAVAAPGLVWKERIEISLYGQRPTICVLDSPT